MKVYVLLCVDFKLNDLYTYFYVLTFFSTLSFISAIKFAYTLIYYIGIDNYNRIGLFILISRVEFKCDFIRVLTPLCTLKGKSVVFPQMAFKDYHFVLLLFEQGEKIYCQKDTKCVSRKFRQIGRILFSKWAYYVFCVKFEVLNRYAVIFLMTCVCEI